MVTEIQRQITRPYFHNLKRNNDDENHVSKYLHSSLHSRHNSYHYCQCERSVSALRRLKTYMRGTMAQERLNGLAALSVHRNLNISENEIIHKFARMYPKRMQMIDILHSDITVEPN